MSRPPARPAFHAVLLAGGSGTRFWPLSRARRPKQFLELVAGESLLRASFRRVRRMVPASRVWVVAPKRLSAAVRRELPGLAPERIIVEPTPKDTAPAIALACSIVARDVSPETVLCVFPTDHVVREYAPFERAVASAVREAGRGSLVCLGVVPDRPATGFGYIRCERIPPGPEPVGVERFVEKPDVARARRWVRSGRYLWNAGIFVWRAGRFLEELERNAPSVLRTVRDHLARRSGAWSRLPRVSVDYAVLEKASGVKVVPLRAGWDDLGSWQAMARQLEASGARPRSVLELDSPGSAVFGSGKPRFRALVGVPGVVVVDTDDALLVIARERSEDVKQVVGRLAALGREDLL